MCNSYSRAFSTTEKKATYESDPYDSILQMNVMDQDALNERIRLFYKKGQKDLDEFDNILLQLTMQVM